MAGSPEMPTLQLFLVSVLTGGNEAKQAEITHGIAERFKVAQIPFEWRPDKDTAHESYAILGFKMPSILDAHRALRSDNRVRYVTPLAE